MNILPLLLLLPVGITEPLVAQMSSASPGDTLRYTTIINGQKAGYAWLVTKGNTTTSFITYNDRGKGPRLTSVYRVNDRQMPTSLTVSGTDYGKVEVHETFQLANGIARLESNSQTKELPAPHPAVFLSSFSEMDDMLEKALLAAPGGEVDLLPAGRASLKKVGSHTLKNGQPVGLYAISGLGFTPRLRWLDASGNLLGIVDDLMVTIREGMEADAPDLARLQQVEASQFYRRLVPQLTEPFPRGLAVRNVRLFDAERARAVLNQTVLVRNGLIEQVGPAASIRIPAGYHVLDGSGKTLLPGLWDMHVHFGDPWAGIAHLALGVTSLRDMGNSERILTLRSQIDSLHLIGPRVAVVAGVIDGKGPFSAPAGPSITSAEEGVQAVCNYAKKGYPLIKLYTSIRPEWVVPIVAEAHRLGLRVAGHIPSFMTAEQAIAAGYDEITHSNMVLLNFLGDTLDTRSTGRFTKVAERGAGIDLSGPDFARFVALMQQKHIAFDPTLGTFEGMFTAESGQYDPAFAAIVDQLPTLQQRYFYGRKLTSMGALATQRKSYATMLDVTKRLHDAGILMVAGTDGFPGYLLHRELELYVKAGILPTKALQMATYNPALLSRQLDRYGTITPGKVADLVLVSGDPTTTISDIRRVDYTVKAGVLYESKKLLHSLSIRHYSEP